MSTFLSVGTPTLEQAIQNFTMDVKINHWFSDPEGRDVGPHLPFDCERLTLRGSDVPDIPHGAFDTTQTEESLLSNHLSRCSAHR